MYYYFIILMMPGIISLQRKYQMHTWVNKKGSHFWLVLIIIHLFKATDIKCGIHQMEIIYFIFISKYQIKIIIWEFNIAQKSRFNLYWGKNTSGRCCCCCCCLLLLLFVVVVVVVCRCLSLLLFFVDFVFFFCFLLFLHEHVPLWLLWSSLSSPLPLHSPAPVPGFPGIRSGCWSPPRCHRRTTPPPAPQYGPDPPRWLLQTLPVQAERRWTEKQKDWISFYHIQQFYKIRPKDWTYVRKLIFEDMHGNHYITSFDPNCLMYTLTPNHYHMYVDFTNSW